MKDSQRQKVYDAEDRWTFLVKDDGGPQDLARPMKTEDARRLIGAVSMQFGLKLYRHNIHFEYHRMNDSAGQGGPGGVYFGSSNPTKKLVLHELAHRLQWIRHDFRSNTRGNHRLGHGGDYTQAMLDIVKWVYDTDIMERLEGVYRFRKITVGAKAEHEYVRQARKRKMKAAAGRPKSRHGERRDGYMVATIYTSTKGHRYQPDWVMSGGNNTTYEIDRAGIALRRSTAERWARRMGSERVETHIIKVETVNQYGHWVLTSQSRSKVLEWVREERKENA